MVTKKQLNIALGVGAVLVLLLIGMAIRGLSKPERGMLVPGERSEHGVYPGPGATITGRTDIVLPMLYSTILEPMIEVKSDTGSAILVLFDTGSSAAWFASTCPGKCAQVMQANCPHCHGWAPQQTKDVSSWQPPQRDRHCETGRGTVPKCFSCRPEGGRCECSYGACGGSAPGQCSALFDPKAAKVTFTDAHGQAFVVCAYVGKADGTSFAVQHGGLSGILGMWNFTSPFLNPQHMLYSIFMSLGAGGRCLPRGMMNLSFDSWVDVGRKIRLKAVIQDTSLAHSTDVHHAALLPSKSGFYLIRCTAVKIGGNVYPMTNQTFILDTGTAAGGSWSAEIWCLIQKHMPPNVQIHGLGSFCEQNLPQLAKVRLAATEPIPAKFRGAPTISFKIQGIEHGGKGDFWWTFRPRDYIFAMDALQQGRFTTEGQDIGYLYMTPSQGMAQPNQSLLGNLNFLNHSLTFDFLKSSVSFRNLDQNGSPVSRALEAAAIERLPPTLMISEKRVVPLPPNRGPIRRPQVHVPDVPMSQVIQRNVLASLSIAAATRDCCRESTWPGCG